MPNISGCSRLVLMPTSCAPVGDCISARTALPSSVSLSSAMSPMLSASATPNITSLLAVKRMLAELHRLGQVVVAAQVAAPYKSAVFCTRNIRPKPTIRLRASNTSTLGARAASWRKHSQ
jgi:hypothetical protein